MSNGGFGGIHDKLLARLAHRATPAPGHRHPRDERRQGPHAHTALAFSIVVVETPEENRVMDLLEQVANLESQALFVWNAADCMRRKNRRRRGAPTPGTHQTERGKDGYYTAGPCPNLRVWSGVKHIYATMQNGIYVLQDAHPYLNDPIHQRLIKTPRRSTKKPRTWYCQPQGGVAADLLRLAARFDLDLPDAATLRKLIADELAEHGNAGAATRVWRGGEAIVQHLAYVR